MNKLTKNINGQSAVGSRKNIELKKGAIMKEEVKEKMISTYGNMKTKSKTNDECYTPSYGVEPLLKYIPKDKIIWCPFDKEESEFVKLISKTHKVIFSHIDNSQDFLNYEPKEHWDIIISNPPFSIKEAIFERAKSFNKPFALLMIVNELSNQMPYRVFKDEDLQLLLFNKRIEYDRPFDPVKKNCISFGSAYFCLDFLPKQLIIEELNKPTARELKKLEKERLEREKLVSANNTNYEKNEVA